MVLFLFFGGKAYICFSNTKNGKKYVFHIHCDGIAYGKVHFSVGCFTISTYLLSHSTHFVYIILYH